MNIDSLEQELLHTVAFTWETMFPCSSLPVDSIPKIQGPHHIGLITIQGAWCGYLQIHVPHSLAFKIASMTFQKPVTELLAEECIDCVKELTNITGGSIKGFLPDRCQLSLPFVESFNDGGTLPFDPTIQIYFMVENEPFEVLLFDLNTSSGRETW